MVEVGKTYIGGHGHKATVEVGKTYIGATVTAIDANKVFYKDDFGIHYNKALDLFEMIYIKRGRVVE